MKYFFMAILVLSIPFPGCLHADGTNAKDIYGEVLHFVDKVRNPKVSKADPEETFRSKSQSKLWKQLEKRTCCDILSRLMFLGKIEINRNEWKGREVDAGAVGKFIMPDFGKLWIFGTNAVRKDAVVLIISSIAPSEVTVLTIDSHFDATVLYNTFARKNSRPNILCYLGSVTEKRPGYFELVDLPTIHCSPDSAKRTFSMKISKDDLELKLLQRDKL